MNRQTRRRLAREIPIIRKPQKSSIDVVTVDGAVAIRFPEPIRNAMFTPAQAKGLATIIMKLATQLEEENAAK